MKTRREAVDEFLKTHPSTEGGVAHRVFADGNPTNQDIREAINDLGENYWEKIVFLCELLRLPEKGGGEQ